ncbi:MAG: hypothetical protein IKG65_12860 [Exiguobacterium sp.]|nr:hypothetical protein [Exiguobacterium sp.]MBR2757268.1 hypothetical protein [Exiguobacterium sp.]MBR3063271.1 hypothetical protein [Exiguobacterium sp.]MBR3214891.1 hypothetical protein [Exiguobacterium sp.]HUP81937.1 hypothetical protein [Pirellula sp.]
MSRFNQLVAGGILLFLSGLLYTLERIALYIRWYAEISTGSWLEKPTFVDPFLQNGFVTLFLFAAIPFFLAAMNVTQKTSPSENPTDS